VTAVLLGGCTSGGGTDDGSAGSPSAAPSSASAAPLPPAENIRSLDVMSFPAHPFPDFALTVDGRVWVSGVDPGIVGYDAVSGEVRARVPAGEVPLAMEQGFGSLWAGEVEADTGDRIGTVVRIDPGNGRILARVPVPGPGLRPESSLAVTDDAVWGLLDGEGDGRMLVAIDPADNAVRSTFPAPPAAEALRGGFGSLWVATGRQSVARIDPADGRVQATVATGFGSRFMAVGRDAVWVLNQDDGTASRIDPGTDAAVATVRVSEGRVSGGDIAVADDAVWVRTETELATAVDPATNRVVRVLGPPAGSGSVAVADGAVWITVHDQLVIHRVPTG